MTSVRFPIHFTSQREYVNVLVRGGTREGEREIGLKTAWGKTLGQETDSERGTRPWSRLSERGNVCESTSTRVEREREGTAV